MNEHSMNCRKGYINRPQTGLSLMLHKILSLIVSTLTLHSFLGDCIYDDDDEMFVYKSVVWILFLCLK